MRDPAAAADPAVEQSLARLFKVLPAREELTPGDELAQFLLDRPLGPARPPAPGLARIGQTELFGPVLAAAGVANEVMEPRQPCRLELCRARPALAPGKKRPQGPSHQRRL